MTLEAGVMSLSDIINPNKKTMPIELRNFFLVMEVYGNCPKFAGFQHFLKDVRYGGERKDILEKMRNVTLE